MSEVLFWIIAVFVVIALVPLGAAIRAGRKEGNKALTRESSRQSLQGR